MKLSIISTTALAVAASAVPHGSRHRRHAAAHQRRDVVIETVTNVVYQTAPAAVVYVNQDGNPMSTGGWDHGGSWGQPWGQPEETSSAAPVAPSAPAGSYAPPAPEPSQGGFSSPPEQGSSAAPSAQPSAAPSYSSPSESSAPAPSGSTGGAGQPGYGMSYAPYNGDGSCKTSDQIAKDFDAFSGYGTLRIYGTDCDQVSNVLPAAKARNMKLFAGIWDVTDVASEAQLIIDAAKGDWSAIDTVSVGNEAINSGTASVDQVVAGVKQAKSLLSAAGFTGNVVTVDTFNQIIENPQLCEVSDFAAANCHAFFDSSVSADGAGAYVKEQAQRVQQACGGKNTIITETGWPSNGQSNGNAVPSEANQKAAIDSLRSSFSSNIVLFSAFNDAWKDDFDGSFGAEKYWGIYGNPPSA